MKIAANKSSGFTLVEVLIAVVILSIGLLGLAGLQTLALRQNTSSQSRSNAVELINDLTDRMRANVTGVDANAYNGIPADPGFDCMTDFTGTASGTGCSAAEMATFDLFAWQTAVGQALPVGAGQLQCTDSADTGFVDADGDQLNDADTDGNPCTVGSAFLVSVTWTDGNVGGAPVNTTFAVTFQP